MFAVPGWSISVSIPKTQFHSGDVALDHRNEEHTGEVKQKHKSRKRKRGSNGVEVTQENVGKLWQEIIEGRTKAGENTAGHQSEQGKHNGGEVNENKRAKEKWRKEPLGLPNKSYGPQNGQYQQIEQTELQKPRKRPKKEKRTLLHDDKPSPRDVPRLVEPALKSQYEAEDQDQRLKNHTPQSVPVSEPQSSTKTLPPPEPQSTGKSTNTPKLTPLQQKMSEKLLSARFRHLNQTLYTTSSTSALHLFANTPSAYESYHQGFRAQVRSWPSNPIEGFIEDVKRRAAVKQPKHRHKDNRKKPPQTSQPTAEPLPRGRDGACVIVDLGCGDAHFAASLVPLTTNPKKYNLTISSFDLAKGDTPNASLIAVADITDLRSANVRDMSVDVAVCCLSLMGTNWVGVVDECARIVRSGGEVWVAEIKSRFGRPKVKKAGGAADKKARTGGKKGGRKGGDEDEDGDEGAEVEMEELEEKKVGDETDVSAFVEVFRRRGFVIKGEVEKGNKMFVKMRFVKVAAKVGFERGVNWLGRPKFVEVEGGGEEVDESTVLKPCVYKTR